MQAWIASSTSIDSALTSRAARTSWIATSDANPYGGGHAATSTDGGQTFTSQASSDLKFLTVVAA